MLRIIKKIIFVPETKEDVPTNKERALGLLFAMGMGALLAVAVWVATSIF